MADNFVVNAAAGGNTFAADEIAAVKHQRVKVQIGADGTATDVSTANPMPVNDAGGSLTVDGTVAVTGALTNTELRATAVPVSGPLTDTQLRATAVPVSGTVTASGPLTDTQLRASAVPVSAASLPLPTGAATETTLSALNTKVTACNTGAVVVASGAVTADTELTTADLDTGAGTDTRAVVGIVGSKSGGAQLIPGDATAGLKIDLGADNDVTITSGTLTAVTTITNVVHVDDNAGSLTVDNAALSVVGGGAEATAQRVTIANDSTGVLSVDDNGGNLSIDDGGNSITVDQATGTNLHVVVDSGTITVSGGGGDGAILDGVSSAIKATVLDYTNSNPLAVRLTDTAGDYVGAGAGTQYTEDAAAAADPIGSQLISRRRDSLSTETTTDGDVTAVNATAKGELYVKHVDAIPVTDNAGSLTIDGTVAVSSVGGTVTVAGAVTNTVLSVVGSGTEATAQRVTIATDSTGVLSVDDNAGSLTVDGAVTVSGTATVSQSTATNLRAEVVGPTADDAANPTAKLAVLAGVANAAAPTRTESHVVPLRTNLAGDVAITLDGETQIGQIADGVTPSIKATVLDLANSNPLSVVIAHPGTGAAFGAVLILGEDTSTKLEIINGGSGGQALTVASGSVPHGNTDSSLSPTHDAPIKIGGKAASSAPTPVTAGQRVNGYFDLNGRLIVHDDQAIPAGTNAIGKLAANSGVDIGDVDVTSLPALATGTNTIGNVGAVAIATGGATSIHLVSAGSGDATNVKAGAGKLLGWYISNTNAAARYIKFHNTVSTPTPGSGVVMAFMIPAGGAANMGFGEGIDFATGIAFSLVTGAADADTTGVAASEMIINLWFK